MAGERAAAAQRLSQQDIPYNLQIGRVSLLAVPSMELELNDNIVYSNTDPQSDLIIRPQVNLVATIPITEKNAFYSAVAIGYSAYVENSQYNQLFIRPGSQLGYDIYVGDFRINLHDQLSYTQSPVTEGSISGVADFGEFSNRIGLNVDWDSNDLTLTAGYDHGNVFTTVSTFSYLDGSSETVIGRAAFHSREDLKGGIEASLASTDYRQNILSDNLSYSVGPFVYWQASQYILMNARGGYSGFTFAQTNPDQPNPDVNTYYFALQLQHRLNKVLNYTIDAGRQTQLGVESQLLELWYLHHRTSLQLIRNVGIGTDLFLEQGDESGAVPLNVTENFRRWGAGVNISYQLTTKLKSWVAFEHTTKNSNVSDLSYQQNKVIIGVGYQF